MSCCQLLLVGCLLTDSRAVLQISVEPLRYLQIVTQPDSYVNVTV